MSSALAVRRRPFITLILSLCLMGAFSAVWAASAQSRAPQQLYVAPTGNDDWPGTKSQPFATLAHAQQVVRGMTASMTSNIVVNLRAGTYSLGSPLDLSAAAGDSGKNGNRVIYRAYRHGTSKQERVTLSGGTTITGWQEFDAEAGIWKADVGNLSTRQLYVNGRRAKRPELGGIIPGDWSMTEDGYVTHSTEPQSWVNPEDIEMVMQSNWFDEPRCGVQDITGDASSTTITMDQPCFDWALELFSGTIEGFPPLDLSFFPPHPNNSLSFLRDPGTFYLDRSEPGDHVLYYIPRPGESMTSAKVIAPVLESLVRGRGTEGQPLKNITLRGFTFAHATWLGPDAPTGFLQWFGPIYEGAAPPVDDNPFALSDHAMSVPAAVSLHESRRVRLTGNRLKHLGAVGIEVALGSSNNRIVGNVIRDTSDGGIELGNRYPNTDRDLIAEGNVVKNNWVHHTGKEYGASIGIFAEVTKKSKFAHNQVNSLPYSGLVFGLEGTRQARVAGNKVFNTLNLLFDGGGIYGAGSQGTSYANGARVVGNWTYDNVGFSSFTQEPSGIGFGTDDFARYVIIDGNLTFNNGRGSYGGCLEIQDITLTHNYWDNDVGVFDCGPPTNIIVTDNTLLPTEQTRQACRAISECKAIMKTAGVKPAYRGLLDTPAE